MNVMNSVMWANCHARNVALVERDDDSQVHVSLEDFAAVYVKRHAPQRDRSEVVGELRSLGFSEVPVHPSKWAELSY